MKVHVKIWIEDDEGECVMGDGRLELLKAVMETGSLKEAADKLGMSYRYAWGKIQKMEKRLGMLVMERQKGGKEGGGRSDLTEEMSAFIESYEKMKSDMDNICIREFIKIKPNCFRKI